MPDEPQRPTTDDRAAWNAYWTALSMPWRTEPDIAEERQRYLAERRAIAPDIETGVYPFKDVKLSRADVEWLLSTHESCGRQGPVVLSEQGQWSREGVDVRGANLCGLDLSNLPLARLVAGLTWEEWQAAGPQQREMAATHLEGANLYEAHLEEAFLRGTHLERADLLHAHLEGTIVSRTYLAGANLERVFLDSATVLDYSHLHDRVLGAARLVDVHWSGVNLATVQWRQVPMLGDEQLALQRDGPGGQPKDEATRLAQYEVAARANRQLATALREQGLTEDADRFAYRAQILQRCVLQRQGRWGTALGSWLLDVISGYGYKPLRSFLTYILVILAFASLYLLNAQFAAPHLTWDEALVLSVSSFHGRGFFSSGISLSDTLARLAAGEAIIGLLIEITFIATFTQRFFAR